MTTFSYDFTGTTGAAWPSPWTNVSWSGGSSTIQSNRGRIQKSTTANSGGAATHTGVTHKDFELTCLFTPSSFTTANTYLNIPFRDDGTGTYYALQYGPWATFYTVPYFIGGTYQASVGGVNYNPSSAQVAKRLRLRVVGSSIRVRMWDDGQAEPGTWQLDLTDTTATGSNPLQVQWYGPDTIASFTDFEDLAIETLDAPTEALRPTAVSGLTNLTGASTAIDQDPDGAITDPGLLIATVPNASRTADYADAQTTATGFANQLTTPANAVGSSEATTSATIGSVQNTDYANFYTFDETTLAAGIPSTASITAFSVRLRDALGTLARGDVGVRADTTNGTQLAAEDIAKTGLGTALPTAGTGVHTAAVATLPTRAQLVAAAFGVRVRYRRTASQAATYTLDWLRLETTWQNAASALDTRVDVAMADPVAALATGAATGEIRARVRKVGSGTSNPLARIEVRNAAGTLLTTAVADTAITDASASGQLLAASFDQALILDKNDVVLRFVGSGVQGAGAELVAVEWNAQTQVVTTTRVTSDADLRWAVRSRITDDVDLRWAVLSRVTDDVDLRWAVLSRLTNDADLRWSVVAPAVDKDTDVRFTFPTPPGSLVAGVNLQEFRVELRKVGADTPTASFYLYENGVQVGAALGTAQPISSTTGEVFAFNWDAASLSDISGAGVELRVLTDGTITGYAEVVDVEWTAAYAPAGTVRVTKDADLRWQVAARITDDVDLRWAVLSRITDDVDLRWAVRSRVTDDVDLRWAVLSRITDDVDLRWAVRTRVTDDVDLRWAVRSSVTDDVDLRWAVASGAAFRVTDDVDLRWAVLSRITDDVDLRWAVRSRVTDDVDLRWAVASGAAFRVTDDVDLRWAVAARVTDDVDLRWAVRTRVTDDVDLRWAVRTTITDDVDLRWAVAVRVTDDADLRWAVRSTVAQNTDLRWRVSQRTTDDVDLRWAVRSSISDDVDLRWRVVAIKNTDVLLGFEDPQAALVAGAGLQEFRIEMRKVGSATPTVSAYLYESGAAVGSVAPLLLNAPITSSTGQVFGVTWNAASLSALSGANVELRVVTQGTTDGYAELVNVEWNATHQALATTRVTDDLDLRWRTSGRVGAAADLRWAVRSRVTSAADLQWAVRTTVTDDVDLRWAVRSSVTDDVDLRWAVRARVTDDVDLRWAVRSSVTDDVDLRWAVRTRVTDDVDLRWAVAGPTARVTDDADLRWAVRTTAAQSVDLRWAVRTSVTDDVDLRWAVRTRVTDDADLRWRVAARTTGDADLRWAVRTRVTDDVDLRWAVAAPLTRVAAAADLRWAVRARVTGDTDLRWGVRTRVSDDVDLRWAVLPPATTRVTDDVDIRWRVSGRITDDVDLRWAVRARVSAAADLRWAVLVGFRVSDDVDLRWRVIARVGKDADLLWRTNAFFFIVDIAIAVAPKPDLGVGVAPKLDPLWDLLAKPLAQPPTAVRFASVEIDVAPKFAVEVGVAAKPQITWDIAPKIDPRAAQPGKPYIEALVLH